MMIKSPPRPFESWRSGNKFRSCVLKFRQVYGKELSMRKAPLALAAAAVVGLTAVAAPSPAKAWRGGFYPGLAGGLIAGAVIGGIASSAYAYGPGYGYGGYGPYYGGGYYGGGYAPAYYGGGYAPYGGYSGYGGYYGGPYVRRVYRPAYAYYGRPYYRTRYYGW
jgi:hypothetical protein